MELYIGSIGHRYGDPCTTFAAFDRAALEDLLDQAVEHEIEECKGVCDIDHEDDPGYPVEDCGLCNPDVVSYGAWYESTPVKSGIFGSFGELLRTVREMREDPNGTAVLPGI